MRPLRYSINVTLDGCCDHRAIFANEDLHRHAVERPPRRCCSRLLWRVALTSSAMVAWWMSKMVTSIKYSSSSRRTGCATTFMNPLRDQRDA